MSEPVRQGGDAALRGQVCPACQAAIDLLTLVPWGDGQQRTPAAPWICATCAALGVIELATGRITLASDALWQPVRERNPALWQEITQIRARIRQAQHPEEDPHA